MHRYIEIVVKAAAEDRGEKGGQTASFSEGVSDVNVEGMEEKGRHHMRLIRVQTDTRRTGDTVHHHRRRNAIVICDVVVL